MSAVFEQKTLNQEIADLIVQDVHWTEEMYFKVAELNHLIELSDGKLVIHDMPIPDHQIIASEIFYAIKNWTNIQNNGRVLFAPMPVRLWEGKIREPDIIFYAQDRLGRIKDKYGEAPNLAVEIVSEDSRHRDQIEKMAEYAKAGIEEYWIVDTESKTIEVYSLSGGRYHISNQYDSTQTLTSSILSGFELPLSHIFKE